MAKKRLTDKIREGIVIRFACCYGPEEVRAWLKEECSVDLQPSALSYYNANNPAAYARLSPKLREIFDRERKVYLAEVRAPIAFKAHRLQLANDAAEKIVQRMVSDRGVNIILVEKLQQLLEYAAKEDGGAFTNRRRLDLEPREALAKLLGVQPDELPEVGNDA